MKNPFRNKKLECLERRLNALEAFFDLAYVRKNRYGFESDGYYILDEEEPEYSLLAGIKQHIKEAKKCAEACQKKCRNSSQQA